APWIAPLPPPLMSWLFAAMAVLGCAIAAGVFYRAACTLFFLAFTYVELIDKTTYLNHYYLVTLISGLLIVLPADRVFTLARAPRAEGEDRWVPAWPVSLLRFQVAVVYVFAGLAKLDADWLFEAQPLRIWLAARSDLPVIGPLLGHVWTAYAFSWFGAFYDL